MPGTVLGISMNVSCTCPKKRYSHLLERKQGWWVRELSVGHRAGEGGTRLFSAHPLLEVGTCSVFMSGYGGQGSPANCRDCKMVIHKAGGEPEASPNLPALG